MINGLPNTNPSVGRIATNFCDFIFKGQRYPLNTVVQLKTDDWLRWYKITKRQYSAGKPLMVQVVKHFQNWQGTYYWVYAKWYPDGYISYYMTTEYPEEIIESIVELGRQEPLSPPIKEYYKDWEVPEVMNGWKWYVAAMLVMILLRDMWMGWSMISIYFFTWRHFKKRKPDTVAFGFNWREKVNELNAEWKAGKRA